MRDSLSRFDQSQLPDVTGFPGLVGKLARALRSSAQRPVGLTKAEADHLIAEGGGPDPDHPAVPQQMFTWRAGGKLNAVVVVAGEKPRCWRI